MSFTTGSVEFSRRLVDALRLFKTTVSFGSVNSLCEMPCTMSHASIPSEKRTLPADLIRLSVGIEDAVDLLDDLQRALEVAGGERTKAADDVYDSKFEDLPVVPKIPETEHHVEDLSSTRAPASSAGKGVKSQVTTPVRFPYSAGADFSRQEESRLPQRAAFAPPFVYAAVLVGSLALVAWRLRSSKP